jgi:hypothetical protein
LKKDLVNAVRLELPPDLFCIVCEPLNIENSEKSQGATPVASRSEKTIPSTELAKALSQARFTKAQKSGNCENVNLTGLDWRSQFPYYTPGTFLIPLLQSG